MKRLFKRMVQFVSVLLVGLPALGEILARRFAGRDVFFYTQSQILSLVPGKTGWYLRNAYYHLTLEECPFNCCIDFGVLVTHSEARFGNHVYIGARSTVGVATIGDETMLADGVQLLSGRHQHGMSAATATAFQNQERKFERITIGKNCWIGTNAIVMSDVGESSIVGAGAVVIKSVEANSIVAGVPARSIRDS
jgi:virginiamycin A acetyltransferase